MTTHVFIVDWRTFKFHLEYLFAGTGAKEEAIDFNNRRQSSLHYSKERNLVGMIADANRVRKGDQVIFYLQQNFEHGIREGKFFGVFEVISDSAFLDNYDAAQYLTSDLGKSLTFRVQISPLDVYADGVTEWEALDEIKCLSSPCQMLWSLIYRKLKGVRGNTMITTYEAERLLHLIRNKNQRRELDCENKISFELENQKIVCIDESQPEYAGRQECINILPRMLEKNACGQKFEVHLQAYLTQNLGRNINHSLDAAVAGQGKIEWIGNEVSCGVGMQRIDVMLSVEHESHRSILPIELKCEEASVDNLNQIQRYIDWVKQYYVPNLPSDIVPVLLAKRIENKMTDIYQNLITEFNSFNGNNQGECAPLRYIEFAIADDIVFTQVEY